MSKPLPPPNYTQTPNAIFALMPLMSDAELRVTLAVCRQTFGWQRNRARLSLSTLKTATGLSKQGVLDGIARAEERGHLAREPVDADNPRKGFHYFLLVNEVDKEDEPLVNEVDKASQASGQALVKPVDHLKESSKERVKENEPTAARSDKKDERPTASRPAVQEPSAPSPTSARVNEARARRAREEEAWREALAEMQRDCEGDEERFGVWSLATGKRAKALAKAHKKSPDELLALWRAIVEAANKPVAYLNSIANAGTWQPPAAPRRPTKKLAFWVDGERVIREVPA